MQVDVQSHAEAIDRSVTEREFGGQPARVVTLRRNYSTAIEDLWDALTDAERIPRWFLPVSGDLRLGGRYQLEGNAGGTITECEPPRRLALTWEFGDQTSWVVVTLDSESDGRARLELEHVAHTDAQFMQFWNKFGPGAVGVGWDLGLMGLAQHIETGAAVDHEASHAWLASDEGKAFVAASSDAWANASAAFGTPAKAARAAAGRTTAFYIGTEETEG